VKLTKVIAEVTGSVWEVLKQPGDTVAAGETIVLVESMKMEIPVEAPAAGRLAELRVAKGDAVNDGDTVATIEAG
jgi:biotin carboxyl carrier protein